MMELICGSPHLVGNHRLRLSLSPATTLGDTLPKTPPTTGTGEKTTQRTTMRPHPEVGQEAGPQLARQGRYQAQLDQEHPDPMPVAQDLDLEEAIRLEVAAAEVEEE